MQKLALSETEVSGVRYEKLNHENILVRKRMFAVDLYEKGFTQETIALILDISRQTVHSYIKLYKQGGLEALKTVKHTGQPSKLTQYKQEIKELFENKAIHNIAAARDQIGHHTGIWLSPTQIRQFLLCLGMRFRKVGQVPAKANPQKQAEFVANELEPLLDKAKKEEIHLLFMDAAHFILSFFLCCVWSFTKCIIPSAAGRNRLNVLGAINPFSLQLFTLTNTDYICADTICQFLSQIHQQLQQTQKKVYIVLDNARYQHCLKVKEHAVKLDITLVFLPPYSPNLNLIERLWKFVKKKVLYAKYYPSPLLFHKAILDFIQNIHDNLFHQELKSLLNPKFQALQNVKF